MQYLLCIVKVRVRRGHARSISTIRDKFRRHECRQSGGDKVSNSRVCSWDCIKALAVHPFKIVPRFHCCLMFWMRVCVKSHPWQSLLSNLLHHLRSIQQKQFWRSWPRFTKLAALIATAETYWPWFFMGIVVPRGPSHGQSRAYADVTPDRQ